MTANIVTIGDEILIGQVIDTNSTYIASEFDKIGIKTNKIISVPDTKESIFGVLDRTLKDSDIIVLTGGLGPTNDDITKISLAEYFNTELIPDQVAMHYIENHFKNRGLPFLERNKMQALIPANSIALKNQKGSAPGMLFRLEDKILISLPGVPFEMKDIMDNEVLPYLKANFSLPVRINQTFLTTGVPESLLAERLKKFEEEMPSGFSLAYLPSPARVRLRLSATGSNEPETNELFTQQKKKLEQLLKNDLYGYDNDTLEGIIGQLLIEKGLTVSTAESCTGGNIARSIVNIAGASAYFKGSVIAYSNEVKKNILNVSADVLEKNGAVSKPVVVRMAESVRVIINSDFGIATSGVAGPTGGSKEKPVGTVWIAVATPDKTIAREYHFGNDRKLNIIRSTIAALNMLRKEIIEKT